METFDIAIVGMGASGTLVAAQLARQEISNKPMQVVCFSGDQKIAKGVAYGTTCPDHLLNVPAGKMSGFPDEPDHFIQWITESSGTTENLSKKFVERQKYGDYLGSIISQALGQKTGAQIFTRNEQIVSITKIDSQLCKLNTDAGGELLVRGLVLALGNLPPKFPAQVKIEPKLFDEYRDKKIFEDPWKTPWYQSVGVNDTICFLGAGLTMIDMVTALKSRGHRGVIYAVSRHGLLPWSHNLELGPIKTVLMETADGHLRSFLRKFRLLADSEFDPRQLIDSLRSITPDLWQRLSDREGRTFLRHLSTYWDVVRHRVAPEVSARVQEAISDKSLVIKAGRIKALSLDSNAKLINVDYLARSKGAALPNENFMVDYVVNCTGPTNFTKGYPSCIAPLVREGVVSFDRYGMGLNVDSSYKVPGASIWGIGPMCRGTFWETTAMPEIRAQAQKIASSVTKILSY